jgi:hypothetical protein
MRGFAIAALVALVGTPTVQSAETPGRFDDERLFTTAEQREYLNALRAGSPAPERPQDDRRQEVIPPEVEKKARKKQPSVTLHGFVRRSDGRSAVWANHQSTLKDERLAEDIRIDSGRIEGTAVLVTLPDGRKIRLEPGQVWDADRNRVVDVYGQ